MIRFVLLTSFILFAAFKPDFNQSLNGCKAWIEIEGEINNLSISAKFKNDSISVLPVNYILKTTKEGRTGKSSTLQRGNCISAKSTTLSLSESRMNLLKRENLYVRLYVYHNKRLIAQDSVVFYGDNQ